MWIRFIIICSNFFIFTCKHLSFRIQQCLSLSLSLSLSHTLSLSPSLSFKKIKLRSVWANGPPMRPTNGEARRGKSKAREGKARAGKQAGGRQGKAGRQAGRPCAARFGVVFGCKTRTRGAIWGCFWCRGKWPKITSKSTTQIAPLHRDLLLETIKLFSKIIDLGGHPFCALPPSTARFVGLFWGPLWEGRFRRHSRKIPVIYNVL